MMWNVRKDLSGVSAAFVVKIPMYVVHKDGRLCAWYRHIGSHGHTSADARTAGDIMNLYSRRVLNALSIPKLDSCEEAKHPANNVF